MTILDSREDEKRVNVSTSKRPNALAVLHVIGARPNFRRVVPITEEMGKLRVMANVIIDARLAHKERALVPDASGFLEEILDALEELQERVLLVFPTYPRMVKRIVAFGFDRRVGGMRHSHVTEPLGYLAFLTLMADARLVMTDSGGSQEEITILNVRGLPLRDNTEGPVKVTQGADVVVRCGLKTVVPQTLALLEGYAGGKWAPELRDGDAGSRIVRIIGKQACNVT